MKSVGFIGAYDKTDMIMNIAKILTVLGKRVIMIDSTINQKAKYVVPVINPTTSYITEFEEIDVAVGFNTINEIKQYTGTTEEEMPYDIALVDADSEERIKEFDLYNAEKNYFVTAFDMFSLKKGLEILSGLNKPMNLTKVLYSKYELKEEDDYLNYLSLGYKIIWNEYRIYFPVENGDLSVLAENQRVAKIKFKKLSTQYKDSLEFITEDILKDVSSSQIRKAIKTIERGV